MDGYLLVEDRDTAKGAAEPFAVVLLKFGVHGLEKGSNEWFLECRADNVALLNQVADCVAELCK